MSLSFFLSATRFLAADSTEIAKLDSIFMVRFLASTPTPTVEQLADGGYFCSQPGITCHDNQTVSAIDRRGDLESNLDMAWLPPTVETVVFVSMRFRNKLLETRRLPKVMQSLSAVSCMLLGTLDLRSLPVNMSYINVKRNDFWGTLDLTHLPESMQTLFAIQNAIETIVFSNRLLPKAFQEANFYQIKKIRMVPIDKKKADSRISLLSSDIPAYVNRMGL